ncbi:MAG: flagellar hook-basal body complex protein [Alphaproteobacteria bacterium]|nr:flagellar hook-basal body complex protein [Alphaproteobacteria bacterium]
MSFFSSLYASTSGMMANSRATEAISQNIANLNTIGFKRSNIAFRDVIAGTRGNSSPTLAGVQTQRNLRINQQGSILQTSSTTETAISGNGMFVVKRDIDSDAPFYFTRNGQFDEYAIRAVPDADPLVSENTGETTYLRNAAGFYLYGWALDADGEIVGSNSLESLVPLNVGILETTAIPTEEIIFSANLDGYEDRYDPHTFSTPSQLPATSQSAHFTRSISVYDAAGTERAMTFEFRRIVGPMAHFTSDVNSEIELDDVLVDNPTGPTPGITDLDTLEISNGSNTLTVTFVAGAADVTANEAQTMNDLLRVINNYTVGGNQLFEARLTSGGQLLVQSVNPSVDMGISTSSASVLGSTGFNFVQDPDTVPNYIYEPDYDINGTPAYPYADQADFPAFENSTTPNTQTWWEMRVMIPDPADPDGDTYTELRRGLINFNGDGSLNATTDADGAALIDLSDIDFDSSTTTDDTNITMDIARLTQFSGEYTVIEASQDGAGAGVRSNILIDQYGTVSAAFSNGVTVDMYRIPLALFNNINSLQEESGTAFSETELSGEPTLLEPDTEGAGILSPSSIENSNVDLADEMSNLIVTQRAFGLNSQVVNAVNEMTQQLSQLKR